MEPAVTGLPAEIGESLHLVEHCLGFLLIILVTILGEQSTYMHEGQMLGQSHLLAHLYNLNQNPGTKIEDAVQLPHHPNQAVIFNISNAELQHWQGVLMRSESSDNCILSRHYKLNLTQIDFVLTAKVFLDSYPERDL